MSLLGNIFVSALIVCFFYVRHSVAAPIDNSAIQNSADAWTGLVANIAPLLILIGERHVKAYFKTMSSQSHYLLYAASPIGLVTAIVTLVRLHGTPLMKRIIGRQFETQADVYAEVSSVSYGNVGLVYRDEMGRLEQSTSSQKADEAHCGIYLGVKGTGDAIFSHLHDGYSILEEYRRVLSLDPSPMLSWYSIHTIHLIGSDVTEKAHWINCAMMKEEKFEFQKRIPYISQSGKDLNLPEPTGRPALGSDCQSSSVMYLSGPGMDPTLSNSRSFSFLRYSASVIGIGLNLVIVAIGIRNEETLTSTFMGIGVAGSFLGSWWIARMIAAVGRISKISLRKFRVLGVGFFSREVPHGRGASSPPRCIAISTISTESPNILFVCLAILLSTLAFISLYLGLRSAPWWKPLAVLGVVGAGACSRAILTEDGKLDINEDGRKSSDFSLFRSRSALCQHMITQGCSIPAKTNTTLPHHINGARCKKRLPENSNEWTILMPSGHIHALLAWISTDGLHDPQAKVLFNAYAIAAELYSLNLEPRSHESRKMIISDCIYVQSEFLGKDAVWQQRLNLSIPRIGVKTDRQQPSITYRKVAALLRIWVTEALSGTQRCFVASQFSKLPSDEATQVSRTAHTAANALLLRYSNDNDDNEINDLQSKVQYKSLSQTTRALKNEWTEVWSNKVMLWMAVKIIFALNHDFGAQIQQEYREMVSSYTRLIPEITMSSLFESSGSKHVVDLVPWYISQLSAAQLVTPRTDLRFRAIWMQQT